MNDASQAIEQYFLEMRWRCLSLAADLDRIERAAGGANLLASDARMEKLLEALRILRDARHNRAEQVQLLFSDKSPPPNRQSAVSNRQ